jgi:hypothetical protein
MTVILSGFADKISPGPRAKLAVRASIAPRIGNTIAPSPGAGKVPGPAGAR